MGTSAERSSSNTAYYTRGDVLPGIWIDGMDVLAVRNGFEFAIKHAVETGPVVIEVLTYRLVCFFLFSFFKFQCDLGFILTLFDWISIHLHSSYSGHSMSDPGTSYRSREEVQGVRQTRDPINLFKERIISGELITEDEIKKIDGEIKKKVDEATKFCKADKEIGLQELYTDVYSKNIDPLIRGILPDQLHKHNTLNKAVNL